MLKVIPHEAERVLVIEAQGMISVADMDGCADALEQGFPGFGVHLASGDKSGIGLLLEWEHLDGWKPGAKTLGTVTGKLLRDVVHKVAIVADEKWHGEEERIQDINTFAEVRWFSLGEREHAWTWLTS